MNLEKFENPQEIIIRMLKDTINTRPELSNFKNIVDDPIAMGKLTAVYNQQKGNFDAICDFSEREKKLVDFIIEFGKNNPIAPTSINEPELPKSSAPVEINHIKKRTGDKGFGTILDGKKPL